MTSERRLSLFVRPTDHIFRAVAGRRPHGRAEPDVAAAARTAEFGATEVRARTGLGAALPWRARLHLVNLVAMSPLVGTGARQGLLRAVGYDVGDARLEAGTVIRCTTLSIGDGSFLNHRCFLAAGDITIGRNVFLSVGVTLSTGDHRIGSHDKRAGEDVQEPIVIEDGCWLGVNAVVLRGVRIAAGCIVGAGAVVTKDTEPDGVYVGVPARRVRDLA